MGHCIIKLCSFFIKLFILEKVLMYLNLDIENLVTLLNVDKYEAILKEVGYDKVKTEFLVYSFRNGFPLGYQGNQKVKQYSHNLRLNVGDETILWNKVMKEVKLK